MDDIIESGIYVGSGKYVPKSGKIKQTIRFDYFETPTTIGEGDYLVTFDVEVYPGRNNYRTHKVINEMDLIPLSHGEAGTYQPHGTTGIGPSMAPTLPQEMEGVKGQELPTAKASFDTPVSPALTQDQRTKLMSRMFSGATDKQLGRLYRANEDTRIGPNSQRARKERAVKDQGTKLSS